MMDRITVKISVQAEIDKVWIFYTKPEHITNWNFANEEWCCPKALNDLKPNRKFSWRMEAKDGSMGFDFEGTYENVIEKELITYKMTDGRKVDIEFVQNENEVLISQTFDADQSNSNELQRAGWQAILENFKKYVELE